MTVATTETATPEKKRKRNSTAHLKEVPQERKQRDEIREAAARLVAPMDKSNIFTKDELKEISLKLLAEMGHPESYLGFTMVSIANEFWRDQVSAIDYSRRLLLLPHCLKNAEGCPADYDEFGLDCESCGACSVADFKGQAEKLGYKVLVSEGTPIVLKIIVSGHVDAIVGVACLNVLEKAIDKILLAGIPCVATPLLSSNCKNTSVDDDWVFKMITLKTEAPQQKTKSYVPLMRTAHAICEDPELSRLAPRPRASTSKNPSDPLVLQENIAYEWLGQGGKRSRPFITLAAYDALNGAKSTKAGSPVDLPDGVKKAALAIETFHKASLVHDDIEDDDSYRYGRETLHRRYGVSTAINVGDYLIGLGYRLVSRETKELGGDCVADILNCMSDAHVKLSEGQGAELLWRDSKDKALSPLDALKIYALKTSPAFEAALYSGIRLAGPADDYEKMVRELSKNVGVAFQILNDLKDWEGDEDNKLLAGQDVLSARPTLLLALALEGLGQAEREELLGILEMKNLNGNAQRVVARVRELFEQAKVFVKAEKLVEKYRARAEAIADEVEPVELRELLYYLIDTVLEHESEPAEEPSEGVTQMVQLGVQ